MDCRTGCRKESFQIILVIIDDAVNTLRHVCSSFCFIRKAVVEKNSAT